MCMMMLTIFKNVPSVLPYLLIYWRIGWPVDRPHCQLKTQVSHEMKFLRCAMVNHHITVIVWNTVSITIHSVCMLETVNNPHTFKTEWKKRNCLKISCNLWGLKIKNLYSKKESSEIVALNQRYALWALKSRWASIFVGFNSLWIQKFPRHQACKKSLANKVIMGFLRWHAEALRSCL